MATKSALALAALCSCTYLAAMNPSGIQQPDPQTSPQIQKAIKDAHKAHDDILYIGWTTNKNKRLVELEQLGALLLIDFLDEMSYQFGTNWSEYKNVTYLKKTITDTFNTKNISPMVDKAHQWAIGRIDFQGRRYYTDKTKFAFKAQQSSFDPKIKLNDLNYILYAQYEPILYTITQKLKKQTLLPDIRDLKTIYAGFKQSPQYGSDEWWKQHPYGY